MSNSSDLTDWTFTCFESSEAAFSEVGNCLYFTILLIYGIISTIIILALAIVLCVQEQKNNHIKYDSDDSDSDTEFQANPFRPGANNLNLGYNNQAYQNQQPLPNFQQKTNVIQPSPTAQMVHSGEFGAEQTKRENKKKRSKNNQNNFQNNNQNLNTNLPRMNVGDSVNFGANSQMAGSTAGSDGPELEALRNMLRANPQMLSKLITNP